MGKAREITSVSESKEEVGGLIKYTSEKTISCIFLSLSLCFDIALDDH